MKKAISCTFNNKDYKYIITYQDERNQKTIRTNETPHEPLLVALGDVQRAIRNYSRIDQFWQVQLNRLAFGDMIHANRLMVQLDNSTEFPLKRQKLSFSVKNPGPRETESNGDRDILLDAISVLKDEISNFLTLFP